jgi:peptidoglycan hydrolase-like protein with peptidoglycan-binding domain
MALTSPRFSANDRLRKASENAPPLKQGERNQAVAILQMALVDLGLAMPNSTSQGRALPDGIFGPETANRVRSFQAANGLVTDAIVGRLTLAALERAIIAQSGLNRSAEAAKARSHSAAVR